MWKLTLGMLVLVGVALVAAPVSADSIGVGVVGDGIPDVTYDDTLDPDTGEPRNVLTIDTEGQLIDSYVLTSVAGIFTGEAPKDLDVVSDWVQDADDELSKTFIKHQELNPNPPPFVLNIDGFEGIVYFGHVIGEEFDAGGPLAPLNLFEDLTLTYTIVGEPGIKADGGLIVIPEPSTLMLLVMGLVGLLAVRRRYA